MASKIWVTVFVLLNEMYLTKYAVKCNEMYFDYVP